MLSISFINSLTEELNERIKNSKIERIKQPSKELLVFNIKNNKSKNECILISCSPGKARVHLTKRDFESSDSIPRFCSILRKKIISSYIEKVEMVNNDRIIEFTILSKDELYRKVSYKLVIELFNRNPDCILVNSDGLIIDCLNRKKHNPGLFYHYPEKPLNSDHTVLSKENTSFNSNDYNSISDFLDDYYTQIEKEEIYYRKGKELRKSVNSAIKRISKKLALHQDDLLRSKGREEFKIKADLITSNIWKINKGDLFLECENFYAEDSPIVHIDLNPLKSAADNANEFYKNYRKLKTAENYLNIFIKTEQFQLDYLYSVLDHLNRASSNIEIDSIKSELVFTGFIKSHNRNNKKNKEKKLDIISHYSPSGFCLYIGRNNIQNEEITFKLARKTDYWFHIKNFHGSHVVLSCNGVKPSNDDIIFAAKFAIQYSQLRNENNVDVDYTQIKNIKRNPSGLPGNVIYTNYQTVRIN